MPHSRSDDERGISDSRAGLDRRTRGQELLDEGRTVLLRGFEQKIRQRTRIQLLSLYKVVLVHFLADRLVVRLIGLSARWIGRGGCRCCESNEQPCEKEGVRATCSCHDGSSGICLAVLSPSVARIPRREQVSNLAAQAQLASVEMAPAKGGGAG